jgi:hypothetical protein
LGQPLIGPKILAIIAGVNKGFIIFLYCNPKYNLTIVAPLLWHKKEGAEIAEGVVCLYPIMIGNHKTFIKGW